VVLVSYAPKLAAALSGATIRQLAYWRKPGPDGRPVLTPEYSASRPVDYSFRDVIALRTCVRLREEASLQKVRRALDALRIDLGLREHLSSYRLEVLQPFYVQGRQIPALLEPREHVWVDPCVRGGEPVISGTRIPYDEVAALLRDGVEAEDIGEFFPQVSAAAARDALDFASYVDSYVRPPEQAACGPTQVTALR
jgi:uncharacterized protein (DUF433 family)